MNIAAEVQNLCRGFERDEFAGRLARAQQAMAADGLAALLLTTEAEFRYFTGFQTQFWHSPTRPWFLVIPASGLPIAVVPDIGAPVVRRGFVGEVLSWSSPDPVDDGISQLTGVLSELAGKDDVIAMPMGPESSVRMPLRDLELLRSQLPCRFADASGLISSLRMIKSEAEIARIRHAANIAGNAFDRAGELFHVGQPLVDAFRAFKIECLNQGADDVIYLAGAADRDGYLDIISMPGVQPIRRGDILMLDTGVTFDGYFCDFDRNFLFGAPSPLITHAHQTLWDATEAGLAEARPGVRCQEVFAAMNNVITRAGYPTSSGVGRYGHGLGMQLTEWPSVAGFDHTELQPGMVITFEPSLALPGGKTLVHEENAVVRAGGTELLTRRESRVPRCLPG